MNIFNHTPIEVAKSINTDTKHIDYYPYIEAVKEHHNVSISKAVELLGDKLEWDAQEKQRLYRSYTRFLKK